MARQRIEWLQALGKLFSVFKKVADRVLDLKGDGGHIARLDTDEALVDDVARLLTYNAIAVHVHHVDHEEGHVLAYAGEYILAISESSECALFGQWLKVGDAVRVRKDGIPDEGHLVEIRAEVHKDVTLGVLVRPRCEVEYFPYAEVAPIQQRVRYIFAPSQNTVEV